MKASQFECEKIIYQFIYNSITVDNHIAVYGLRVYIVGISFLRLRGSDFPWRTAEG